MTQTSRFWDGATIGDATAAPYDANTEFSKVLMSISGAAGIATNLSGVFRNELNLLAPTGVATPVAIASGRAITWGAWFENDASVNVAIPTPSASTRIDRIVLRKDWAAQTVRITRVAGVEGGGPPALVQVVGTTWDEPIALASITTGGVITITDQRAFVGGSGLPTPTGTNSILVSTGGVASWSTTPTIGGSTTIQGSFLTVATGAGTVPIASRNDTDTGLSGYIVQTHLAAVKGYFITYNTNYAGAGVGGGAAANTTELSALTGAMFIGTWTNNSLGLATAGAVRVTIGGAGGVTLAATTMLAIGATANTGIGIWIAPAAVITTTVGNEHHGMLVQPTHASTSTTASYGVYSQIRTQAAAFTLTSAHTIYAGSPVVGAGSAITNVYGLRIANQGATGITNAYGLYIDTPSGASTTNISLHVNGGSSTFMGNVGIGIVTLPYTALYIATSTLTGNTVNYGILSDATMSSGATVAGYPLFARLRTQAAAFTMTSGYGVYIDTPIKGAGSTITSAYGLFVNVQTQGGTNNFGIYIAASSGGTNNYGLYSNGSDVVLNGGGALATNATTGFTWLPSCAGVPTGAPALTVTGAVPFLVDTTNLRLYARIGATWRVAQLV